MHKWTDPMNIEEKAALAGAVRRLKAAGCWLDSQTGNAFWPTLEAAHHGVLTVEMIRDAELVQDAPWEQALT